MKNQKTKEAWVPAKYFKTDGTVLDFTGLYEVSDLGRVRSLNYHRTGKTKIMKQATYNVSDGTIFHKLMLRKDNKKYLISVHRLVLCSFDPEGFRLERIVNHKVERTPFVCDNSLANLEWLEQRDNVSTKHCKDLLSKAFTNRTDMSKHVRVTDLTTGEIAEYPSAMEAGRSLGVNPSSVSVYINQRNGYYKKLNLHFEYIM